MQNLVSPDFERYLGIYNLFIARLYSWDKKPAHSQQRTLRGIKGTGKMMAVCRYTHRSGLIIMY
jgi:hypothetical protein